MTGKNSFELQLVVIGILITVFLQISPELLSPQFIDLTGTSFTFWITKSIFLVLGILWVICLLVGVACLINLSSLDSIKVNVDGTLIQTLKKIMKRIFEILFGVSALGTLTLFALLLFGYLFSIVPILAPILVILLIL